MNVSDVLFSRICRLEDDTTYRRLLRLWMFSVFVYLIEYRNSTAISIFLSNEEM
jgi:hypothetical protein